ncbi:MAG: glycosyltransferase family 2 protein, partial [Solirubrobacteraceae bacterium]
MVAGLPITVLIPVYDRAVALDRALRSVARQSIVPTEVLVVDDGSCDDSRAVAERHGARVIAHERNQGQVAARNTVFAAATQPWIAFLDSDDDWLPDHLETLWPLRE